MPRPPDRSRVVDGPRDATEREWELFRRASVDEPLTHVGSVTAPTASVAHEQATRLFPDAADLWLCPADETRRYASEALGARARADTEQVGERGDERDHTDDAGDEGQTPAPSEVDA